MTILFLDFDGVLHPYPLHADDQHAEPFQRTPLLWTLLRQHPALHVVVSSSWRERFGLDYLTDFLTYGGGEDLGDRILGMTPILNHAERDLECVAWLEAQGQLNTPWLALDDQPALFQRHREALYPVNPRQGLTSEDLSRISARLSTHP